MNSPTVFAWLLTYLIHSTVLLGAAWLVTRRGRLQPSASDFLWKVALIAPLITGTIQSGLQLRTPAAVHLPVAVLPAPSGALPPAQAPSPTPGLQHGGVPTTTTTAPAVGLPSLTTLVVLFWAIVALGSSLYYLARRLILVGRLADRRAVAGGPLSAMLGDLKREVGLHRAVRLTMARTISSPVALGINEICVPELALSDLTPEQQRSMLAHELAHLARHDSLWLACASLIERFFFFQPLNRLARQELETTAEYLSDEWAMRNTGSAVALAKCLATVAEWMQASPLGVPVAGLAERRSLLVSRIARLLEQKLPASPASRTGWMAAAAVGVMVTIAAAPHVTQDLATRDTGTPASQAAQPAAPRLQDTSSVVPALIARLKDDDAGVRRAAAQSLGRIGDHRAVQPLIGLLADPEADVRRSAVDALSDLEDPAAIMPIAALLKDSDTDVKKDALNALGHFDQKVPTAGVVELLDDPSADVRHEAVDLLQNVHDRSAAPVIAKLIHDQSGDVREAVINALGDLGDQTSAGAIVGALSDPSGDVRQQALNALENLHAPVPEATLINLMKDTDADVRQKAAEMAGNRSVVAAVPALRALISDPRKDVREAATEALGNIADPAARAALQAALNSPDPNVRRAAAEALGQDRNQ